ncbi:MAG TPA: ATP-binding protein [Prosthecobacter sp.]
MSRFTRSLFRGLSINRKLTLVMMLTTAGALVVACAAFLLYERQALRKTMARSFAIIADTFDDNVSPGLTFDDAESIAHTLKTLRANPDLIAARVYGKTGALVAEYKRAKDAASFSFPPLQKSGQVFQQSHLDTFQEVWLDAEVIGTVYLASDYAAINRSLKRSVYTVLVVLCCALLLAYALSRAFRPLIAGPITELAQVAHTVAVHKDYSVRAIKHQNDDLGRLIDAFNEMLKQIQLQDSALQMAREHLEKRVVERTAELAKSVSLLNATLDSTADGIMAVQFTGEVVCHNQKLVEMWGFPPALLKQPTAEALLGYAAGLTDNADAFSLQSCTAHRMPELEAFDLVALRDGRVFERYVKPQRVGGQRVGVVINFRDITQRRQSEDKLAEANERLLATSRQAGMAEVATSILHNVGNVLNSVSVSAEVVGTKVRQTRMSSFRKIADMLKANSHDFTAFFTQDPRGKELPEYLLLLLTHLQESQDGVLGELDLLRKNIEHIKEIVAMQQAYARECGVLEELTVDELVEDAIRINQSAFDRHHLRLEKNIADLPLIMTDRHKVLQILVNLLSNAKYAVGQQSDNEKRLVVAAARKGEDHVTISVTDNGIGIAPDNLTKIFQHGFTTKKNGHGFGLHSGALAARELGGSLTSQSSGVGKGATFILELPLRRSAPDLTATAHLT